MQKIQDAACPLLECVLVDILCALGGKPLRKGGILKQGVLKRKWIVFVDPLFPANQMLMGYQGPSILDTGLIYSPYIPMEITPNFIDPNDLSLRRAVRTRHKITLTRAEFFARVEIDNLL